MFLQNRREAGLSCSDRRPPRVMPFPRAMSTSLVCGCCSVERGAGTLGLAPVRLRGVCFWQVGGVYFTGIFIRTLLLLPTGVGSWRVQEPPSERVRRGKIYLWRRMPNQRRALGAQRPSPSVPPGKSPVLPSSGPEGGPVSRDPAPRPASRPRPTSRGCVQATREPARRAEARVAARPAWLLQNESAPEGDRLFVAGIMSPRA